MAFCLVLALALAQFINRLLENSDDGRGGVLQRAIWATDTLNANPEFSDDSTAVAALDFLDWSHAEEPGGNPLKAAVGLSGYLTQADILMAIGNFLTCNTRWPQNEQVRSLISIKESERRRGRLEIKSIPEYAP